MIRILLLKVFTKDTMPIRSNASVVLANFMLFHGWNPIHFTCQSLQLQCLGNLLPLQDNIFLH
ncbi:hypothetical protein DsansV1_C31g0217051 [Dioscorea sansibarensis]